MAFGEFNVRRRIERGGHVPQWTAQLRAEAWAIFALESRQMKAQSGVPTPEMGFDLESLSPRLPEGYRSTARILMDLLDDAKTLAIGGTRGTGKSTLAWGLVLKFCDVCRPALYRTVLEFFNELTNAPWEHKQRVRNAYFGVHLLVLDEVQIRDSDRQFQDNELTNLIDRRYREGKATLLLSNLEPAALKQNLGDSIWRRLIETGGQPLATNWTRIAELKEQWKREDEARRRPKTIASQTKEQTDALRRV